MFLALHATGTIPTRSNGMGLRSCEGFSRRIGRSVLSLSLLLWLLAVPASARTPDLPNSVAISLATIPFKMVHSKILVPVRINDSEVYDFVLDTGSPVMLLAAPELAPAMRLAFGERLVLEGAGEW